MNLCAALPTDRTPSRAQELRHASLRLSQNARPVYLLNLQQAYNIKAHVPKNRVKHLITNYFKACYKKNMSTPPNANLLPDTRTDEDAVEHLKTLDPQEWTSLILITDAASTRAHDCLLIWLQDINWPIAMPIAKLLLTLVNGSTETRDTHGTVLMDALKWLFEQCPEDDWDWVFWVLAHVVLEIADKVWMREVLGKSLRDLRERVPADVDTDWGFRDLLGECLGGEGEEKTSESEK